MKNFFKEQFRFNQWANEKLLDFIEANDLKNERISPIFSHLTLAQIIWCDRLNNKPTPVNINEWASWPWEEIDEKNRRTNQDLIDFVDNHANDGFDEIIDFVNTAGTPHTRSVRHTITQIVHYTTFHRGEISIVIHEDNITAPSTDFLDFEKG